MIDTVLTLYFFLLKEPLNKTLNFWKAYTEAFEKVIGRKPEIPLYIKLAETYGKKD